MRKTLILTGWGWKEYPVAAAVALKAVGGEADVAGMSRRRLPEFLELYSPKHKQIIVIGVSSALVLGGIVTATLIILKKFKGRVKI